jgi:hypothetical protein
MDLKQSNRQLDRSQSASGRAGAGWESRTKSGHFSIVPLLLFNRDISAEARRALVESRLRDAAEMLVREHGLSCVEAGDLLGVAAC